MNNQLTAIIVDDEERARNTLATLLHEFCPSVKVESKCSNVMEAVEQIKLIQPDIVFLDIEMPEYNGFELFDFFEEINFEVIFVTAYDQYAIKAFEVSAIDYLLKPVEIELLQKAVEKAENKSFLKNNKAQLGILKNVYKGEEIKKIALPLLDGLTFVELSDISVFIADGAYTNVIFNSKNKILVSKRLKFFEDLLENRSIFFRAHRSSLINVNYIKKYLKGKNTILMDDGLEISLSRDRKQEFENLLKVLEISY
jgi:two-component system LytT family response regulator